jgi:hypothetical protein
VRSRVSRGFGIFLVGRAETVQPHLFAWAFASDKIENLIVLCPTCHTAFHRGTYSKEAIRVWKITLLQLNNSYDRNAVNLLLLLDN